MVNLLPLTFYDIPGNAWEKKAWSPNCWKGRYAMNIRGLEYTTVWVEYLEIEETFKKVGIAPTGTRGGKPLYTCPAIIDPNTGTAIGDSLAIAEYLEKTYPDPLKPTLLPAGTRALQLGFRDAYAQRVFKDLKNSLLLPNIAQMNPESGAYWRRSREEHIYGKALEEVIPDDQRAAALRRILDGLHVIGSWIDAAGEGGPFLMGKNPCFADVDVASTLRWAILISKEDEDGIWSAVAKLDGGRWAAYAKEFEKWEACP